MCGCESAIAVEQQPNNNDTDAHNANDVAKRQTHARHMYITKSISHSMPWFREAARLMFRVEFVCAPAAFTALKRRPAKSARSQTRKQGPFPAQGKVRLHRSESAQLQQRAKRDKG